MVADDPDDLVLFQDVRVIRSTPPALPDRRPERLAPADTHQWQALVQR